MGTWGTRLSSNDIFSDVYGKFFELYNEGQDVKEITDNLLTAHKELFNDIGDSNNFWFAIAKAQWECKALDNEVYNRVKAIIESKKDLDVYAWQNKLQINWFISNHFKKDSDKFQIIDMIKIDKKYDYKTDLFSSSGDWYIWIIEVASLQFERGRKNLFGLSTKTKKYVS